MKILVTGGTGLIGRYCLDQLLLKGYEVHGVSSQPQKSLKDLKWHQANLLDINQVRTLVRSVKPSHLLHLAWCTQHGKYWTSLDNLNWVQSSLALIEQFTEVGGERIVAAGTCAEYEWGHGICIEERTPIVPATLYGTYKNALQLMLQSWSKQTSLSSSWARVFSLYGPAENPSRLVASVISSILKGAEVTCSNPAAIRDYMHAHDVASAFIAILESNLQGPVNIGSGEPVKLGEIIEKIAIKLQGQHLVRLNSSSQTSEPVLLLADISRLSSTGWTKRFDLETGLTDTINWWRAVQ